MAKWAFHPSCRERQAGIACQRGVSRRQAIDRLPGSRRRPVTACHGPATISHRQAIDRLPGSRRRPVTVCRRPATACHRTAYVYG